MYVVLLAAAFALAAPPAGATPPAAPRCDALATYVASCAVCHEAQCSGRLTFPGGPEPARSHVRRHAGALSDARADELIEVLRAIKEECRVHPAAAADCGTGPWDARRLRRAHAERENAWFVPLGAVTAGRRRLALRFDRDARAMVRISTARFDALHEALVRAPAREGEVAFVAPGGEELFVRVQVEPGARLVGVELRAPALDR